MPYYNRYSRYGYRFPYYSNYSKIQNSQNVQNGQTKANNNYINNNHNINNNIENSHSSKNSATKNSNKIKENIKNTDYNDEPLFQLFGINLYFDDILLICLIFFLYQEGVKDESLFIALIMLLLS